MKIGINRMPVFDISNNPRRSWPLGGSFRGALGTILVLIGTTAGLATAKADGGCSNKTFKSVRYTVCSFDPAKSELRLFWRDGRGRPFRFFSTLAEAVRRDGGVLKFAMNAGMFLADFTPVGLYVENGRELRPANTANVRAGIVPNFYKKPNGVFYIHGGKAQITTTERFLETRPKADYATQSGPMLVIERKLHPAFIENSNDRTRRTGVGVSRHGVVLFAISEKPVNFYDFGRFFRDRLGTRNALFLDGGRGTGLYYPGLGRNDLSWHGGFGVVVRDTKPEQPSDDAGR